jgi:uncharacterized protein YlxW (UPF0749 family)
MTAEQQSEPGGPAVPGADAAPPAADEKGARGGLRSALRPGQFAVAVVAALTGLLIVASADTSGGTDLRGGRAVDSRDLVARSAQRVAQQEADVAALRQQVSDLTAEQGTGPALEASQRRTATLAPVAGLTPVVGPGLTVTLDDAQAKAEDLPGNPSPDDLVVHQQDVQAVVNALWKGGASAVQVMDQRIVSTSAVRCVGNTLILQGQVYSPPFRVTAVGDVGALTQALDEDPNVSLYREYVDLYGLGWDVDQASSVRIPPYTGPLQPTYAQTPLGG